MFLKKRVEQTETQRRKQNDPQKKCIKTLNKNKKRNMFLQRNMHRFKKGIDQTRIHNLQPDKKMKIIQKIYRKRI